MKKLIPLAFLLFAFVAVSAQSPSFSREVMAAGGGYFVSPEGSLSWTLGEAITETFENLTLDIILTQGFQQPDDKNDTIIGIWEKPASDIFVSLYPNPTAQTIALDLKYDETSRIRIGLVDMLGRELHAENLDVLKGQQSAYRLDVSLLSPGMYMFRLTDNGRLLNSYKFQKIAR